MIKDNIENLRDATEGAKCEICDKSFYNAFTLKLHKRSHAQEKPYACDQFSKRFYEASARKLKIHKNKHKESSSNNDEGMGKKDNVCNQCNKSFYDPYNLKRQTILLW